MMRQSLAVMLVALALTASAAPLFSQDNHVGDALDALVAAYPGALARQDGNTLHWRDGTVMSASDGAEAKTFPELLRKASLIDQLVPSRGWLEMRVA